MNLRLLIKFSLFPSIRYGVVCNSIPSTQAVEAYLLTNPPPLSAINCVYAGFVSRAAEFAP